LEKLKHQIHGAALKASHYDRRFSQVIRELRERKLDADHSSRRCSPMRWGATS
jgi:hypothetical protein